MLERALVIIFETIMFIAAGSFALIWLAGLVLVTATLIRVWRASESADPFEWLAYIKSPAATDVVQMVHLGSRLVRYGFVCVAIAALSAIALGICATLFHIK